MADRAKGRLTHLTFGRNGENILTIETNRDCRQLFDELHEHDIDFTLQRHRERRSLDANAYAWVLIGKIAEATGAPVSGVYREAVRELGGNTDTVCVRDRAVEKLRESWARNGLGWQSEITTSKIEGCTNVILYYGSSTFDTKQMSRFIDGLIQDCKSLGIETMTPEELSRLVDDWNAKTDKGVTDQQGG